MIEMGNYGQERDLICTEEEREMYNALCDEFQDEDLQLVRVSDNYVSVKRGEWDIVRMKFTNRAKWLLFPLSDNGSEKHIIERTAEVEDYFELIRESLEIAKKYED